jgi:hypothetical protein
VNEIEKDVVARALTWMSAEQVRWQLLDAFTAKHGPEFTCEQQIERDVLFEKWCVARSALRLVSAEYTRTLAPAQIASLSV